jgi:hypothetical protein
MLIRPCHIAFLLWKGGALAKEVSPVEAAGHSEVSGPYHDEEWESTVQNLDEE